MNPVTDFGAPTAKSEKVSHTLAASIARGDLSWIPAVEWSAIAILLTAFFVFSVVPGWRSLTSEFPDYYLAAQLHHQGIPLDRVYEWTWLQRQNDHLHVRDGLVSFAPNPPSSILPLLPLTRLSPLAAKRVWILSNLVLLALSLAPLHSTTQLGFRRILLIALLCTLPLRVDFLYGRYYVLILFLVCVAYYASCRNRHVSSGIAWSCAAAMKLFPALAVILFIRKRNWRSLAGFVVGAFILLIISIALFGMEVHQVFLREVIPQASRGDWLGPYVISQNSFVTLWSRLFLFEPELNPAPLLNSPALFALAMAITVATLLFGFLLAIDRSDAHTATALHWATLGPLLLLLSTSPAADHSCILIFTAVVAIDALLALGNYRRALAFVVLYVVACAPIPLKIANWVPHRLVATSVLYILLLITLTNAQAKRRALRWWPIALAFVALLATYHSHHLRNRDEDFARRLPTRTDGYRFANPVPSGNGFAFTAMQPHNYSPVLMSEAGAQVIPVSGDALSLAGSRTSDTLFIESASDKSIIVKSSSNSAGAIPQAIGEGQDPVLSPNGKWLAFLREEHGQRSAWLGDTDSSPDPEEVLSTTDQPIDLTVSNDGDVIASVGLVSDPKLVRVRHGSRRVTTLSSVIGTVRYPAISPDGQRLAFSRRERGSWHLFVQALDTGSEQQLTHAACNAISASWADDRTLLYATDCGRGVGLSAIARVRLPN